MTNKVKEQIKFNWNFDKSTAVYFDSLGIKDITQDYSWLYTKKYIKQKIIL